MEKVMDKKDVYSPIKVVTLDKMRIAKYIVISLNPEDNANTYMDQWAEKSGLLSLLGYKKRRIGWDFPFISLEQCEKFGLHGYVSAYIIPEDFIPKAEGVEISFIEKDTYATLRITDWIKNPWETVPSAY
jgi:hypothetical protein